MGSARDALRQAGLSAPKSTPNLVEYNGQQYELRKPSVKVRGSIVEGAKIDRGEGQKPSIDSSQLQVLAVVRMTYVPGTNERVFEEADIEGLLNQECGGAVDVLSKVAMKLLNVEADSVGKASAPTPSANSATE